MKQFRNPKTKQNVQFGHLIYDLNTNITIQRPEGDVTDKYYTDNGYFEVIDIELPKFDPSKEYLSELIETVDIDNKKIIGRYDVLLLPQKNALQDILDSINLKKYTEILKNDFDDEAQAQRYATLYPEKWGTFGKWIDDMNLFWDDVKAGGKSILIENLEENLPTYKI